MKLPERDTDGKLPAYAWPGGYQIVYYASDNGTLCSKCANSYKEGRDCEELKPVAADIYWEGPSMLCQNCDIEIESAYGDPDAPEEI